MEERLDGTQGEWLWRSRLVLFSYQRHDMTTDKEPKQQDEYDFPWTEEGADELISDYEEALDQEDSQQDDESSAGDSAETTIFIGGKL